MDRREREEEAVSGEREANMRQRQIEREVRERAATEQQRTGSGVPGSTRRGSGSPTPWIKSGGD